MTIPVALLLGLIAGSALAWLARGPLADAPHPLRTRYSAVAVLIGAGGLLPATLGLFLLEPAWSAMYVVHPGHGGVLVWPLLVGGVAGAPTVGLLAGRTLLMGERPGSWWAWSGLLGASLLACLVAGLDRLRVVAPYETFHYGDGGVPLAASDAFWPILAVSAAVPLLLAYSLVQVQRHAALVEDLPLIMSADIPFEALDAGDSRPPTSAPT